jgi:hypothetical protein
MVLHLDARLQLHNFGCGMTASPTYAKIDPVYANIMRASPLGGAPTERVVAVRLRRRKSQEAVVGAILAQMGASTVRDAPINCF